MIEILLAAIIGPIILYFVVILSGQEDPKENRPMNSGSV